MFNPYAFAVGLASAWRSSWSGPLTLKSPELARLWSSAPASTGIAVSEETALAYAPLWACMYVISSDTGSLPLIHYKRGPNGGKERYGDSKLYSILHDEPNPEMSSMTMRETMTGHMLTWGNGYAEIERDLAGRPLYLWPITPDRVRPYRDTRTQEIWYHVAGTTTEKETDIPAPDMIHVPGLGFDGLCGYSVVAKARESIGLGIALERFGGTFFGNGSTFGGHLSHPLPLNKDTRQQIRESIEEVHTGVHRAHKFLITGGGMKYERLGIPPDDAQFLETRRFQIEEQCRWFRMPPHKIQHLERSTNNNIEHQGIEYLTDCLSKWLTRWEQELNRKLIPRVERRIQFIEHVAEGMLRGDVASRYAAYAVGRQWGWLSADDVRDKENMNPLPNGTGTIYLVPMNMTPADRITELINAQIAAKKTSTGGLDLNTIQQNALTLVEAIRAALTEAQQRAEAHLTRALAAEALAADNADLRAEAERLRAAATLAQQDAGTLRAVLLEVTEREARDRTERETTAATFAQASTATGVQIEALTTQVATAEHGLENLRAEVAARTADREVAQTALTNRTAERDALQAQLETRAAPVVDDPRVTMLTAQIASLQGTVADRETALTMAATNLAAAEARVVAETDARTMVETTAGAARESERTRHAAVIGAHRGLIADAMGRMIRRETEKARRAQATPEKLRAWMATFYPAHADICQAALLPAIRVHLAWAQSADDPALVTAGFVKAHIDESLRQLRLVLESDAEDVAVTLETTFRHWELDRADVLADRILQQEIAHVSH